MDQAVVIFSGHNMRAIVAFCRCAVDLQVPFHIVAASDRDPVFDTQYSDSVFQTRQSSNLDLKEILTWLEKIRRSKDYRRLVILPTSEFLNRFLLENRSAFEQAGCLIPLVNADLYHSISDKHSFVEICSKYQLSVPCEFDSIPARLPFVAKPLRYASSRNNKQLKPWLLTSPSLLEQFRQQEHINDFFFQELLIGKSTYLLYYVSQSDNDVLFSQENLIQQCNGGSIIAARNSSTHNQTIARQYLEMLKNLGYWGVLMVELKETPDGYVMIEANPRFWGPIQFTVDNAIPIIPQFLLECGFPVSSSPISRHDGQAPNTEFYFWSGGMTQSAQPLIFHNYSERCFLVDYPRLINHDVYLRDDTINLYATEIRKQS